MSFVVRHQTKMYYEYCSYLSEADVLVMVHGLGLDHTEWDDMVKLLSHKYRILRYDIRGHGKSDIGDQPITLDLLREDLFYLVDSLQIQSFHFIGSSLGGKIGIHAAHSSSDRIQSLILNTVPSHVPHTLAQQIKDSFENIIERNSMEFLSHSLSQRLCYPPSEQKVNKLSQMLVQADPETYQTCLDILLFQSIPLHAFLHSQIPTLFLWGEHDPFVPKMLGSVYADSLPNCRRLIVPNSSQMIFLDQPDILYSWINEFIEANEPIKPLYSQDPLLEGINLKLRHIAETYKNSLHSIDELKVELINSFRVFINGQEVIGNWNQRYAKRLLIYLLFHRTVTREQLYETFWPHVDLESARNRFRVCLVHLKKLVRSSEFHHTSSLLKVDREHISLMGHIDCDYFDLKKQLDEANRMTDPSTKKIFYQQILQRISGKLFPGLYDDWFLELREQIEEQIKAMIFSLVTLLEKGERMQRPFKC
ncbi:alpha/beta fold hydrolase [Caldalkalibacillus mannanilyticus]|uniref:alpha/beta fold hydrolase n=1 Tax=Caldalkalibacillus mannanilyticus TaxID=1418 RepID=UPI0004685AD5|nr:alpha/beta fold hydrolase [Caldalkalibacillus mannanilyticus]